MQVKIRPADRHLTLVETKAAPSASGSLIWNYLSVALLGVTGLLLNYLVALLYDASALGVLNQALAVFVFAGQLASAGIGHSLLAHLPKDPHSSVIVKGALLPAFLSAVTVSTLTFLLAGWIGGALSSPSVTTAIYYLVPGIFFFGMNKVLLSVVNAQNRMVHFGMYSVARYGLLLVALIAVISQHFPGNTLTVIFSLSEGVLFLVLSADTFVSLRRRTASAFSDMPHDWRLRHLVFGLKSVVSGLALEANSRVDILILGLFLDDGAVGVYSVAALMAEGFLQMIVVVQNLNHPIVSRLHAKGRRKELETYAWKVKRLTWVGALAIGSLAVVAYPSLIELIFPSGAYGASFWPFALLMAGIVVASGALGFQHSLLVTGFPLLHSTYICGLLILNVVFNYALVPTYGMEGSAMATALAFVTTIPLQHFLFRHFARIKL